jgi:mono/diheme cytochrome c family protein
MNKIIVAAALLAFGLGLGLAQSSPEYAKCQGCHQATGAGLPKVFPPLAGHVPEILAAKDGRSYLIDVLLWGLQGEITVKGEKYTGVMPAFNTLTDAQMADVLNHISTQWGNKLPAGQKAFTADEVKAARATKMTPAQVAEARKKLGLK